MNDGYPVPNTTCDRILPGRTGPMNGVLTAPEDWQTLFATEGNPRSSAGWSCDTTLAPTDAQTVTLVVNNAS